MEITGLVQEICPTTTQEWVKNGALLVDVREVDEVKTLAYNVPKIINIPLSEFDIRFKEIPKDEVVVMVCRGGGRSLRAAGFLINNGYNPDKVVNMKLGITQWVKKGFPTIGDTNDVLGVPANTGCCGSVSVSASQNACCDDGSNSGTTSCC